jgi:hypothetical protein
LQQCVQVGTRRRWDDDDGLDHRSSRRRAQSCRSAALGGGWTAWGGGLAVSLCVRLTASASDRRSLAIVAHRDIHKIIHLLLQVFYFFPIADRDCVALPYVDISTLTHPTDEVDVACPTGHNNNDTCGRVIYVGVIIDPDGGTTHAYSFSLSKLMV